MRRHTVECADLCPWAPSRLLFIHAMGFTRLFNMARRTVTRTRSSYPHLVTCYPRSRGTYGLADYAKSAGKPQGPSPDALATSCKEAMDALNMAL